MSPLRLRIDGDRFRDKHNREVTLHGINVAGDAKFPLNPDQPSHVKEGFYDGDNVSFVGRPFSVADAHTHFTRLRRWGYNSIRYIFTWEAIEHEGPGKYDEEFIQHTVKVLRIAKDYGFYVWMDPHQDVWARFSGGSGAPMWTYYACGLNPENFITTEAALVQNAWPVPAEYPKMIWATNYTRLACQVMFTLFFGGKDFAPKAIIDGKNIQDYLEDHFMDAVKHLAQAIHDAGDLEGDCVVGYESINEPNRGLIVTKDLNAVPKEQQLKKGTTPTPWQAILTGSGRACEVETWEFGSMGPYKSGTQLVDPKGTSAWLPADYDDSKYGWKRDPAWKLGECIWAQHGVWDPENDTLLKKDYFSKDPSNGNEMDYEYFTNRYFMPMYRKYSAMVKSVWPESFLICQPPVLEIPPTIKGTKDEDLNMVFGPHFYDGVTLISKKWNRIFNVDVFGVLRGKYSSPVFALRFGYWGIRNVLRDQLIAIREEGMKYMGTRPTIFTEIGIPYDMDDKKAYEDGNYESQVLSMDANHYALEGSRPQGFLLWVYVVNNSHKWGDQWNGEDLSIYSQDDPLLPTINTSAGRSNSFDPASPSYSKSQTSSDTLSVNPGNLKKTLSTDEMSSESRAAAPASEMHGFRAAEAYVRPYPVHVHGNINSNGFDLRSATFKLALTSPSSTEEGAPTEIWLPEWHFPQADTVVEVSGGKWKLYTDTEGKVPMQLLQWWHAEGEQSITIKGVKRKQGVIVNGDVDDGYLEQYARNCAVIFSFLATAGLFMWVMAWRNG